MEMKITKQTKNPYLNREEYQFTVVSTVNPTKKDVVALLKKDETLCVVRGIKGAFGKNVFNVEIFVYDSAEAMKNVETITRRDRAKILDEAKKAAEAAKTANAGGTA